MVLLTAAIAFAQASGAAAHSGVPHSLVELTSQGRLSAVDANWNMPDQLDRKAASDKMLEKFADTIKALDMTILNCADGIEWLDAHVNETPYIVNGMIPFAGKRAKSCDLDGTSRPGWQELKVHYKPPRESVDTCVIYCGETDCPAALTNAKNNMKTFKKFCGKFVYLHAGALCFVEHGVPVKKKQQCQSIVTPHNPKEFTKLSEDLSMKNIECSAGVASNADVKDSYVINMMVSVFGSRGKACNLGGLKVHGKAPTKKQSKCVLYCGESTCPIATEFLRWQKDELKHKCGEIHFLEGGAKCFLEQSVELVDTDKCAGIVDPKPAE